MLRKLQHHVPLGMAAAAMGVTAFAMGPEAMSARTMAASASSPPGALSPQEWRHFKVVERKQVSHNTVFVRFGLDDPDAVVGLHVASCLITRAPIGPKETEDGQPGYVIRPYTPVSRPMDRGHFDLVVKVYPQGLMSQHIGRLQVGDTLECKGPLPKLPYSPNMKKSIGMVAGGTGITPMLQVVEEILDNPADRTQVSLIFANQRENDILLKDRIDALAKKHADRFKVFYVVDKANLGGLLWTGGVGYVTEDMVRQHLPPPSDDVLVLVCGPPPMMKAISGDKAPDKTQGELSGLLAKMGYTKEGVFKF